MKKTRPRRGSIAHELNCRRIEFCRPLPRGLNEEEPFFCELGTLWCTEAHGDFERAWYEINVLGGAQGDRSSRKIVSRICRRS